MPLNEKDYYVLSVQVGIQPSIANVSPLAREEWWVWSGDETTRCANDSRHDAASTTESANYSYRELSDV